MQIAIAKLLFEVVELWFLHIRLQCTPKILHKLESTTDKQNAGEKLGGSFGTCGSKMCKLLFQVKTWDLASGLRWNRKDYQ